MRATCQLVCYVFTLFIAWFLGGLFGTAFWQAGFHAKHLLGGKPLPVITEFLITHHRLPQYLMLLPWVAFVGAPVSSLAAMRNYWDPTGFFLRLAAFLAVESSILLSLLFAIALPFVPYYGALMPDDSTFELAIRFGYWGLVGLVITAGVFRLIQRRRNP